MSQSTSSESSTESVTSESTPEESTSPVESSIEESSEEPEETSSEESIPEESSSEEPIESSQEESSETSKAEETGINFQAPITAMNDDEKEAYEFTFHYDPAYFARPAVEVDLDMMMFAYGMANASANSDRATAVFESAGFSEHYNDDALKAEIGADTIGFAIGSRMVDGFDQIIVSVRGEDYSQEWASNFYSAPLEEKGDFNGDHYGFHLSAIKVIEGVRQFILENDILNAKYLFTGYSRGGAVAGLAAAMMIDDPFVCGDGDIYAYTFESPAGLLKEHNKSAYDAIHNCVNENDLIPMLMPERFGFCRPGKDIQIAEGLVEYAPLFAELGMTETAIDESADFSNLSVYGEDGEIDSSGRAGFGFILDILTRELTPEEVEKGLVSYHTKEEYRDNLMQGVRDLMDIYFGLGITLSKETDMMLLFQALPLLTNLYADDGFPLSEGSEPTEYNPHALSEFLIMVLDAKGFYPSSEMMDCGDDSKQYYDEEVVNRSGDAIQAALRSVQLGTTQYYLDHGEEDIDEARVKLPGALVALLMNNALVNRHSFDTTYAVLANYINGQKAQ